MPATTLKLQKLYRIQFADWDRYVLERNREFVALLMKAHRDGRVSIRAMWVMEVDNGRGDDWYQAKWESEVCTRPGFEGM